MAAVSVVVATSNPGAALGDLTHAVDAQSLPAADFELLVADASDDGSEERLRQLAERRPNVVVLAEDPGAPVPARVAAAIARATAERVLVLDQEHRLAPRALEALLATARRGGADVVLGRVVTATASGSAALPDDADRVDPEGLRPPEVVALVRRSVLEGRADAALDVPSLVREAEAVGVVARYACAMRGAATAAAAGDVSPGAPEIRWEEGRLRLTVGLRVPGPAPTGVRSWLIATSGPTEIAVPAATEPDDGDPLRVVVAAVLDPRTAEAGRPLEDGVWDLRVRIGWPDREATVPLPSASPSAAVLDGRPYAVRSGGGTLRLDAGATATSIVGAVALEHASVTGSIRGDLAVLDLPGVHVAGDADVPGLLVLDRSNLRARLVCRDGRARLESHVGSLAGVGAVSVLVGGGAPVPTGLRLRVDGLGGMRFEEVPPPAPAPPPAAARTAQRLRRRLPRALDPAVRRLARVPALRDAYRALISR